MDSYFDRLKKLTSKIRQTLPYSNSDQVEIVRKIDKYFEVKKLKGKRGNQANFEELETDVNNFYKNIIINNKEAEDVITARYICDIYNDTAKSKSKNRKKIEALTLFLDYFKNPDGIELLTDKDDVEKIDLPDWKGTVDKAAPQWADHLEILLKNRTFKSLSCLIDTTSPYYRFGIKLFSTDGKVFGDGSIQSQKGSSMLIHIAKDFTVDQLYICSYKNGVRLLSFHFINTYSKGKPYLFQLINHKDEFLSLLINNEEVYKVPVIKEILYKACLYVWADSHTPDPKVSVKNIKVETRQA